MTDGFEVDPVGIVETRVRTGAAMQLGERYRD